VHRSESPKPYRAQFVPGEQLLLRTDGVTEAHEAHGTFHPPADRSYLLQDPDAHGALEALREDLVRHVGGPPHGDAAMLLLRYRSHAEGTPRIPWAEHASAPLPVAGAPRSVRPTC
jgi:serine phosphatase RsbU (regulator of sigma subunit)